MKKSTLFLPVQMLKYFARVKRQSGRPMAEQIRAILQAHIDANPL